MKMFKKKDKAAAAGNNKESSSNGNSNGGSSSSLMRPAAAGKVAREANGDKASAALAAQLAARVEELQAALKAQSSELADARAGLSEAREIMKEQNIASAALEREKEDAQSKATHFADKYNALKADKLRLAEQLDGLAGREAELKAKLQDKESELSKKEGLLFEHLERREKESAAAERDRMLRSAKSLSGKESGMSPADVAELEAQVAELSKANKAMERQLVDMTGRAIQSGEVAEAQRDRDRAVAQLAEEQRAAHSLRAQVNQLEQQHEATVEKLVDEAQAEARKREAAEALLAARQGALEEQLAAKTQECAALQLELRGAQAATSALRAENTALQRDLAQQREDFASQEQQRLAALDGETAGLLQAERLRVQKEEQRKREAEVEQLLKDQRQAMEAIVSAVRAEEQLNMRQTCRANSEDGAGGANRGGAKSASSGGGLFSMFTRRGTSTPAVAAPIEDHARSSKSSGDLKSEPAVTVKPIALGSPNAPPPPQTETAVAAIAGLRQNAAAGTTKRVGGAPVAASALTASAAAASPRRLHLVDDLTENTADVAQASLDFMSL